MNALKILNRGHQNLLDAVKDLSEQSLTQGFTTGSWTVKDIVDHLATYEELQSEAFNKFLDPNAPMPLHDQKTKGSFLEFNEAQWQKDKGQSWQEVWKRYLDANNNLRQMIEKLGPEQMAKSDATQWYGESCSLDDIIAYNYGHKKHHIAQIKLFRQRNKI